MPKSKLATYISWNQEEEEYNSEVESVTKDFFIFFYFLIQYYAAVGKIAFHYLENNKNNEA